MKYSACISGVRSGVPDNMLLPNKTWNDEAA